MVLNLVRTSDEQTDALVGVVADGGFLVGTMDLGPKDPGRGRSGRSGCSCAATARNWPSWWDASTLGSCASR